MKASKKLKEICYERLNKIYKRNIPENVVERLNWELQMIEEGEFTNYYLEMLELIEQMQWQPWQFGFEGTVGASLVCFLCGITDINPFTEDTKLYPEFFMGYQGNKLPFFGIVTGEQSENIRMQVKLVERTSVYPAFEEVTKPEIVHLLRQNTDGLPVFKDVMSVAVLIAMNPQNFAQLVDTMGIICSDGASADITCREDVYEKVMDCNVERKTAFCIAEAMRRGRGLTTEWQAMLLQKGFSKEDLKMCNKVKYLCSRAHAVEIALQNLRLLYYKLHFPEEFQAVKNEIYGGEVDA